MKNLVLQDEFDKGSCLLRRALMKNLFLQDESGKEFESIRQV